MMKKQKKRLFKRKVNKPKAENRNQEVTLYENTFFRRNERIILLALVLLILVIVYSALYTLNFKISENNKNIKIAKSLSVRMADYPVVNDPVNPLLSARSAVVLETGSKKVIFSKNPQIRFSMASTAKIMTALVALDHYEENSILTIKSSGIEGSRLGFLPGERYFFKDLLYAMMLPSANDAAVAVVDNYPGGRKAFVAEMNKKAKELFLVNTFFSDPAGLDDDGNFTTAEELARLAELAMQNKKLSQVVSAREKTISDIEGTRNILLENLNQLLGFYGVNGVKTGTTEGAGEVLVTSAVINGHTFIIVVMNSEDRFADTMALLTTVSGNVRFVDPLLGE
jgi:serine-type D-Ala-D-Ala carboxypeptidase (penicillin-binding protein 5/6)